MPMEEIQLAKDSSNTEQRDFFLETLFVCTKEIFFAFSKAEIKDEDAVFASS